MPNNETDMSVIDHAHLRIARPTEHLPEIIKFYTDGLGFEILGSFEDHDGFDGVMLGHDGAPYHLEFTQHRGHKPGETTSQDDLLVFYLPNKDDWQKAVERMQTHGYKPVSSNNPYWDVRGRTFEDADGYRIVLEQAAWP